MARRTNWEALMSRLFASRETRSCMLAGREYPLVTALLVFSVSAISLPTVR